MTLAIKNLDELIELKELNFNNPYTQRKFELYNIEQVRFLVENYRLDFAFGISYLDTKFSLYKEINNIYIRNNSKYKFEFPHCPPPITEKYCLKSGSIDEIVKFINEQMKI